jgi:hypothetical protein
MNLTVTCINHKPLKVWLIYQNFKQPFPRATVAPTNKAAMGIAPSAIVRRKITPGSAGTHDPKHSVYKKPIILCNATPCPFSTRQMWFKLVPNVIRNVMSSVRWYWHKDLAFCLIYKQSMPEK